MRTLAALSSDPKPKPDRNIDPKTESKPSNKQRTKCPRFRKMSPTLQLKLTIRWESQQDRKITFKLVCSRLSSLSVTSCG